MKRGPTVPYEVLDENSKTFRARIRLLRRYIHALTVPPIDAHEVVHAVVHDLIEIAVKYDGSFPRACGDEFSHGETLSDAQNAAKEREH